MKLHPTLAFLVPVALIAVAAIKTEPRYPVTHTVNEWGQKQTGLLNIQRATRYTSLPAETRYYIDSVVESQVGDIQSQVSAGIKADTTKRKP